MLLVYTDYVPVLPDNGKSHAETKCITSGKVLLEIYDDFPTATNVDSHTYSTVFQHCIKPTNPVNVASLVEHVARCHSNNNKMFKAEYRVRTHSLFVMCMNKSMH